MLVILTAGRYPDQLRQQIRDATRNLRERGVEIYVVAIGRDVDPRNYYPDLAQYREYVYNPKDYDTIDNVRPQIVNDIRQGKVLNKTFTLGKLRTVFAGTCTFHVRRHTILATAFE